MKQLKNLKKIEVRKDCIFFNGKKYKHDFDFFNKIHFKNECYGNFIPIDVKVDEYVYYETKEVINDFIIKLSAPIKAKSTYLIVKCDKCGFTKTIKEAIKTETEKTT